MKKLIYILCLVLSFSFASCHNDDDLPNVNFDVEFEGAVKSNDTLYIVRGKTLEIESITVTNTESGKGALITAATYYWDGYRLGTTTISPFAFDIVTSDSTPTGLHTLGISCPVFAVDKSAATAYLQFNVVVVENDDDLPSLSNDADFNHLSATATISE